MIRVEIVMALPDVPPGPDFVAAIIIQQGCVLCMRQYGHRGAYYVLPSGVVDGGETLEAACLRCALKHIRRHARDLGQQIETDLQEGQIKLSLGVKVGVHPWERRKYHYFTATGNGVSIVSRPSSIPTIDPQRFFAVAMPVEWIPLSEISSKNIHPPEAASMIMAAGR